MSSRLWILFVTLLVLPISCKEPEKGNKKGGSENATPVVTTPASERPEKEQKEEKEEEEEEEKDECKKKKKKKKETDEETDDELGLRSRSGFGLLAAPNYKDDIRSILSDKCESCHSGDDDYALDTYAKAKKIRSKIASAVKSGDMPKKGSAPLTSSEKRSIQEWVDAGAPESKSSSSDEEEEEDDKKKESDDCEEDKKDDKPGSAADWDELLKTKEVKKCNDKDKIFDRLTETCHKAKIASFDCSKSGVLKKFKELSIDVTKQFEEFESDGYKIDQCGEYNKEPVILFYKKKEADGELKLLIKKLCKKGSAACDN